MKKKGALNVDELKFSLLYTTAWKDGIKTIQQQETVIMKYRSGQRNIVKP